MSNETKPVLVKQSRRGIFKEDGTVLYSITTEVQINSTYTGDSRDARYLLNLFVNSIVDTEDSTKDVFSNYATIADLDLVKPDRGQALASGQTKYRSNVNKITFDNLSVATSAARVVRDTINNLVSTYLKVKSSFVGSDVHYFPYPEELTALRDEYIQTFRAARDSRISSDEAVEASQTAATIAQAKYDVVAKYKELICEVADKLIALNSAVQSVGNKYVATLITLIDAANSSADGELDLSTVNSIKAYLRDNFVQNNLVYDSSYSDPVELEQGTGPALLVSIAQTGALASAYCQQAMSELSGVQAELNSANSELKENTGLREAASQAEEDALSTLVVYCPNLDPASV
jgi:hypothetical protein